LNVSDEDRQRSALMSWLITWFISACAVWITAQVLPGFTVTGAKGALIASAVIGLLSALIGWLLFFVIGVGTLGIGFLLAFITRVVVLAIIIVMTDKLTASLKVNGFGTAFLGSIIISMVGAVLTRILR
jgi:putative membrane protein